MGRVTVFVLVAASVCCGLSIATNVPHQDKNFNHQMAQLETDIRSFTNNIHNNIHNNNHNHKELEDDTKSCFPALDLDRALQADKPEQIAIAACLDVLIHAVAGQDRSPIGEDPVKNVWFLKKPNTDYGKRFSAFTRSDLENKSEEETLDQSPLAHFFSDAMLSVSAEGGGMCELKTTSLGGSVFLMSRDSKVVLKSMVANEATNWRHRDQPLLSQGLYPVALVPALAYFEFKATSYFLMQGLARMGLAYGVPGLRLLDMKGLIGREATDEFTLMADFPRGFGMSSDTWDDTCAPIADAIDFLISAHRMDYSMLMTMIREPLSNVEKATEDTLLVQSANGVFFASDVSREKDLAHPNDDHLYAFHLQGFADHLETFTNKTLATLSTVVVNYARTDLFLTSNPIQNPKRYGCRMFVFLMMTLFVPVHHNKLVNTGDVWHSFEHNINECTNGKLVDSVREYADYVVSSTLSPLGASG